MKFRRIVGYSIFSLICSSCMSSHVPLVLTSDHPASPEGLAAPMYEASSTLQNFEPHNEPKIDMPKSGVHENHDRGMKRENR